jgi:hypothetical protein
MKTKDVITDHRSPTRLYGLDMFQGGMGPLTSMLFRDHFPECIPVGVLSNSIPEIFLKATI